MRDARGLLRLWLTFEEIVDRRRYLTHGVALMALKYAVDAALIGAATGTVWRPTDYLQSVPLLVTDRLTGAPAWLAPALVLWTLPFLWIGISMTIRRLLDAGLSAWWSLLFFIPFFSYVVMAVLAALPSRERPVRPQDIPGPEGGRLPSALLSLAYGTLLGLVMIWLAVKAINSYGLGLFMGTPFAIGLVTAFIFCRRYPASARETLELVVMTVLMVAGATVAIGYDGAVCVLMTAPLGIVVALMGGAVGRFLARSGEAPAHGAVLLAILLPGSVTLEGGGSAAALREVRSAVVIDAPPEAVWPHVIAFAPIPEPTSLLFRAGIAYPMRAEIQGSGVGAVRYCVFSTGAFVEPITVWEPGRRLAFDVVESPPPMRELTLGDVVPAHLDGYLAPRAGEFRLVALPNGRTRLEGSTWYEQRLRPEGYWVVFSDRMIGTIHRRVLDHIKAEVEQASRG